MEDPDTRPDPSLARRLGTLIRSRRAKRAGLGVLAVVALYALLGFFVAPPVIKALGARNLGEQLGRPVTIGRVALNPFTLRLEADDIHVGGREADEAFVDVGQLAVRVSWKSLARFAPVVGEVRIAAPSLHIIRYDAQRFNFSDLLEPSPAPAQPEDNRPLDLTVERIEIVDGAVSLTDAATGTTTELALKTLAANLENLSLVGAVPGSYSLSTDLASGGSVKADGRFDLGARWAEATLSVDALALPAIRPYLKAATPARVLGGTFRASVQARADWSQTPFALTARDSTLGLNGLRVALPGASDAAVSLAEASVAVTTFDLAARRLEISKVEVSGLAADAVRGSNGEVDLAAFAPPGEAQAQSNAPAWHYAIGEIALKDARATFVDNTLSPPAKLALAQLSLTLRNVGDDLSTPVPVALAATPNAKGTLALEGEVRLDPLKIDLKLDGTGIDVTPFAPYATSDLNARIDRATLDAKGEIGFEQANEGPRASYRGDLALADVRVINRTTQAEFAGWRSLALDGLAATYDTAKGVDVDAARVVFASFYGHVLLDEQGRLHLRDILAKGDESAAAAQSSAMDSATPGAAVEASGMPVRLHFGKLELQDGQVTYTDNFITPHYTAELAAINGSIGAFGTDTKTPAPIDVGARLTANGPISIKGKVNPLVADPSLDLRAVARDIELTNLTAYSTKYTGYPITKGKLNVNLHYRLAGDRLKADNRIFIDQLTFGPRVENDTATQLPVQLAISLLKNSRGQIDVDIPVAGSLDDPQFSISGLVWNAVGNLVKKAITAPFTLLAHALGIGGGEELGHVEFAPGAAELPPAAADKLDTIAKMLAEKPSIDLDLIGRVDPEIDTPALRDAVVAQAVKAEKLKDLASQGRRDDPATVVVVAAEYERYLADAYRAIAKPVPGAAKPSRAEMEAALAEHAAIDLARLQQLAQDRAQAVRTYLDGKIAAKRVFIVAPKLTPEGIDDQGATTRVDFSLK